MIALSGRSDIELIGLGLYLLVGAIQTMPEPGTPITSTELYSWFYRWTHVLLNSPMAARFQAKFNEVPAVPAKEALPNGK